MNNKTVTKTYAWRHWKQIHYMKYLLLCLFCTVPLDVASFAPVTVDDTGDGIDDTSDCDRRLVTLSPFSRSSLKVSVHLLQMQTSERNSDAERENLFQENKTIVNLYNENVNDKEMDK